MRHQSSEMNLGVTADDPRVPPLPERLTIVKLFLELALYTPALLVLHGIMASDDQDVEAWYLEGLCFCLMAQDAKATGGKVDGGDEGGNDISWEELGKDAKDCLQTCETVRHSRVHSCP